MTLRECDIHNHLLPGLDDGFQREADSLQAIRKMSDAGCREFVFTPHINPDVSPLVGERQCRDVYKWFTGLIPAEWNVKTHLAAEYMVVPGFENRVASQADTLNTFEDVPYL